MAKDFYITDNEHEKCRKIMNAFIELYEATDSIVLDAGKYGFVKLQHYSYGGFDVTIVFTESDKMFNSLWEDWLDTQLYNLSKGTPVTDMERQDMFNHLPKEKQKELMDKRKYFEEKVR